MLKFCRLATPTTIVLTLLTLFSGCGAVRFVFGEPYYWQGPPPPRSTQKACYAHCATTDISARSGQMCAFACTSWYDPWYSSHVVIGGVGLLRQERDSSAWRADFTACYDAKLHGETTKNLMIEATEGCAEGVRFYDERISLYDSGYQIHWPANAPPKVDQ